MDGNIQENKSLVHYWDGKGNQDGEELKQLESTIKEEVCFVLSGVLSCQ